jgi:HK97 family phage prohead protease
MLRFEADVHAIDLRSRTIEGVIVPYGEVGVIQGREYRFRPGSIRLARSRTPLLVDHDRARPIGVLAELVDGPTGALARFSIDETPDGDHALIQAASGSRGSLSIGAEVVTSRIDDAGVVDVQAGAVHEVSLLALGAFAGAAVTRVAAEAGTEDEDEEEDELGAPGSIDREDVERELEQHPDQEELELEDEPDDDDAGAAGEPHDPEEGSSMDAASAAPVIIAAGADRPARELNAGELVSLIVRAQHGEPEARRYMEAALIESISTDVSGLLPPTYERTVIGGKAVLRPLYETFRSRPIPGVGLLVSKPKWTTRPDGAWAADVNADATSTPVVIGSQTADVARWDWAGAIPWVVVQRSDPSIVDEIYGEAVEDFYLDVEAKVYAELSTASPGVATTLGGAIAEFFTSSGNQRAPEVIIMAPDVWGDFADVGALSVPLAQAGVDGSTLSTTFAGIPAITSGTLAAGETILATKRAVDARVTEPVRLTANAIGALNVELAVVGEGLFDTDYPTELLKFAAIVPAIATTAIRSTRAK